MTDDFAAVSGERGGYVPCDEVALAPPTPDQDSVAVYGEDDGYVAAFTSAASDVSDDTDSSAVFGRATGYVPGPCVECSVLDSFTWNDMDVGGGGTAWVGTRTDQTGTGSFSHQSGGSQTSGSGWQTNFAGTPSHSENEGRGYASINVGTIPTATHYRLTATLRNYIGVTHLTYVLGNETPVDLEFVVGSWGTGTPTWDGGTTYATDIIGASTGSFDVDGVRMVPFEEINFTATWPITQPYAQWYFRNVSTYGYRASLGSPAGGNPFTDSVIDLRYPNDTFEDTHSPAWYTNLRSSVDPRPLTSAAFEDWTLDVLNCA